MPRRRNEKELREIEAIVSAHPDGIPLRIIEGELTGKPSRRTLQNRLRHLVAAERLAVRGRGRWTVYRISPGKAGSREAVSECPGRSSDATPLPTAYSATDIRKQVRRPVHLKEPVGYDRSFLDAYRPNETWYLSEEERDRLRKIGTPEDGQHIAGTYALRIMNRLLIDLSWNSSRLEGNSYSLIDTRRLIEFAEAADEATQQETQMILNHRDAIRFLVRSKDHIGFDSFTIRNLHALLANNLMANPAAIGHLRKIEVGIGASAFRPVGVPQIIEECFEQVLATASAIEDPFEQSLFVMVQLPNLQPFEDVNERVSRLAANIPFVRANLKPLSFVGLPTADYVEATLGVYELRRTEPLKDAFVRAYERSASEYAVVRQTPGSPDPFRQEYRVAIGQVIGEILRGPMVKKLALVHLATWTRKNVETADRDQFRETVETELLALHEGNIARYGISLPEYRSWKAAWGDETEE